MLKMHISTIVWGEHLPNAGQNTNNYYSNSLQVVKISRHISIAQKISVLKLNSTFNNMMSETDFSKSNTTKKLKIWFSIHMLILTTILASLFLKLCEKLQNVPNFIWKFCTNINLHLEALLHIGMLSASGSETPRF